MVLGADGRVSVLVVAAIIYITEGQRRIPVQYAKRVVGRKVYGGQSTYLPLRINMAGVIPVIFASSRAAVPGHPGADDAVGLGQGRLPTPSGRAPGGTSWLR